MARRRANATRLEGEDAAGRSVGRGFIIGVAVEIVGGTLAWFIHPGSVALIGGTQFIYMMPAIMIGGLVSKDRGVLQGLVLCVIVVMFLNALCFGLVFMAFKPV